MTTLTVNILETVDRAELEQDLVTVVVDMIRDERDYTLVPEGGIVVRHHDGALKVTLRGVDTDIRDLFTGVSGELEQHHNGLHTEMR
jgi:hypothetical protein